ncbi:FAD/FMN-containing dehydrogenase [Kribbella amoyensis]|uniref:FAD/FMN-containing dehydrogenase n=1 Tax=Kribbella amoyensis TaxID=996641 RepID=A0A561BQH2_9ACTN|nr:FAD-binding oxidoreductase [Kribbella amoyensis]TWD81084.1 FAD/FMN-containing dehydrogenase [Kribbella amoyensis]
MTQLAGSALDDLREQVAGPVLAPGESGYDEARRIWNAAVDRRPGAIARCTSAADVSAAVRYAARHGLEISVRGGAHSPAGTAVLDDGLMIDLSLLNHVTVDPEAKRARVGGGALLGQLDAATQAHGLAVPAGMVSHTGVGGLTLGGGMGWLTRKAGMSIDNLVSAEVVTAAGDILRVSDDDHADLFWAIRGGGGNFGVVTEFEFRLHEVGPLVQWAILFYGLDQGAAMFRLAEELVPELPQDVNVVVAALNAPPAPFVPEHLQMQPGYALLITGFGSAEVHEEVVARFAAELTPLFDFATPMPYTALQQLIDEANAWGHFAYDKGSYLESLSTDAIDVLTEWFPRKTSPGSVVLLYRLDHAYSAVDEDATAFGGGRSPRWAVFMIAVCQTPEELAADRGWVRNLWTSLQPHTAGVGSYVNAMSESEANRVQAAYGPKYERLARIKAEYDPDNLFRRNANIAPA